MSDNQVMVPVAKELLEKLGSWSDPVEIRVTELPDGTYEMLARQTITGEYDSTEDTFKHIEHVRELLLQCVNDLTQRAVYHDDSKLMPPEKPVFDEFTPKLANVTYGTPEYKEFLAEMGKALEHHYKVQDHHPEHFKHGIRDMDLLQLVEMLCDWKAASMRHADGSLDRSIHINRERFEYGDEIEGLLQNTARRMGWLHERS